MQKIDYQKQVSRSLYQEEINPSFEIKLDLNVAQTGLQKISTDYSSLSDDYLLEVDKKIKNGTASAQEMLYANEIQKRKLEGRIGSKYENPGHHDPTSINFNKSKSVLPSNHEDFFSRSVLAKDGNRWTKVGKGKKAVYHRFQDDGNGNWHWNGSTDAKKQDGTANQISINNVPIEIKRLNE